MEDIMRKFILIILVMLLVLNARPAVACDQNTGDLLTEVLLPKLIEAGDQSLEDYVKDNYTAALWALIEANGGADWLLDELAEISPRLTAFVEEWVPDALAYLADENLIQAPSIAALIDGWPPKVDDDQLETVALLAVNAWVRVRAAEGRETSDAMEVGEGWQ
jgi:hypothetical protein